MTATLHYIGLGELRVCRDLPYGEYEDTHILRPCWHARDATGEVVGELYLTTAGAFEYWVDGDMTEFALFDAACWSIEYPGPISDALPYALMVELLRTGDGLEVSPVMRDGYSCAVCEPSEADMWSVYVHRPTGGVQCLGDFLLDHGHGEADAMAFAERLLERHRNLMRHGINNSHSNGQPI